MKSHTKAAISLLIATAGFTAIASDDYAMNKSYHNKFNNACETNFKSEMKFSNNQLSVTTVKNEQLLFDAEGRVIVDGKPIELSESERKLAQHYYASVEQAIPMVTTVALEAINITNIALSETFTALLGDNSQLPQLISEKLSKVSDAIEHHVYQNPDSLTFDSAYFGDDLEESNKFEDEIDEIKEEVIASAMGEMLIQLGRSMMSGGGDMSDFEKRMENLGNDIEARAEVLAEELKLKAEGLCEKLLDIDNTENQLQSVKSLRNLNMLDMMTEKA